MSIKTTIQHGFRLLKDSKNGVCLNFATKSVAHRNAEKFSKKFNQSVTAVNIPMSGRDIYYLMAEKAIL